MSTLRQPENVYLSIDDIKRKQFFTVYNIPLMNRIREIKMSIPQVKKVKR
jgi:hypothetical protein